jgi:hypothetical protein
MTKFAYAALAALAAGMMSTASMAADYEIVTDPEFPSVIFIEYDPSSMPHIMTVPEVNPGLPIIRGGQVDGNMTAPAPSGDTGAQSSTQSGQKVDSSTTSSNDNAEMSLDERAQKRTDELLQSDGKGLEDLMIDREIEDTVLKKVGG